MGSAGNLAFWHSISTEFEYFPVDSSPGINFDLIKADRVLSRNIKLNLDHVDIGEG